MREIIRVKNVDVDVEYNDFIYDRDEIVKLLKYGLKSEDNLDEIQAELTIHNYEDVIEKINK